MAVVIKLLFYDPEASARWGHKAFVSSYIRLSVDQVKIVSFPGQHSGRAIPLPLAIVAANIKVLH